MSNLPSFNYLSAKKAFLAMFTARVCELGFNKVKSSMFYGETSYGRSAIGLGVWKNVVCMDVEVSALIRIDSLENLLNDFRQSVLNQSKLEGFSVGSNLGNIRSGVYRKWQIYNDSEIEQSLVEIIGIIKDVGVPFIEKYSNLEEVFYGLISPTTGGNLAVMLADRMQKALAITLLVNRYDLFLKQSSEGEKVLTTHPQGKIKEFLLLRDWLEPKFDEQQRIETHG